MNQPPDGTPGNFAQQGQFPPQDQFGPQAQSAQPGPFAPPGQGGRPGQFPPQDQFGPQAQFAQPGPFAPPGQGGQPGQFPPQDQFPPQGQFPPQDQFGPPGQVAAPGQYGPPGHPPQGGAYWGGPPSRPSRTKMWTIIGVVAAVVVGGGIAAGVLLSGSGGGGAGPDKVLSSYLTALSAGDAATALKAGPPPASMTFLTNDVLAKQQAKAKISNIKIGTVEHGKDEQGKDAARVAATYTFGSKNVDEEFYLSKATGKWLMESTTVEFDASHEQDIPDLTLFGQKVSGSKVDVFPGPLVFGSSDPDLTVTDKTPDDFATYPSDLSIPLLDAGLSPAGRKKVISAVGAKLTACAKVKVTEPAQCPQKVFDFEAVDGTATWRITSNVSQALQTDFGEGLTLRVTGEVKWAVTYRARDFDNKVSTRHDTDETYISAEVDLSKSPPACTLSGY